MITKSIVLLSGMLKDGLLEMHFGLQKLTVGLQKQYQTVMEFIRSSLVIHNTPSEGGILTLGQ